MKKKKIQTIYKEYQCTHMCTVGTKGLILFKYFGEFFS